MSRHGILFNIHSELYLKDPQTTSYGQKLMSQGILLLDRLGFESFNFKKLAAEIQSTEASIYRYFENKHLFLLFLTCWYWEWVNYLLDRHLMNIHDPKERLAIAIHHIVNASTESPLTAYVNEHKLHQVIIKEGSKAYHIHSVDDENEHGFFQSYKEVVNKVANIIKSVSPDFPYPKMLASNLFEMSNNQIYFAEHIPKLTDIKNRKNKSKNLEDAMCFMAFKLLE